MTLGSRRPGRGRAGHLARAITWIGLVAVAAISFSGCQSGLRPSDIVASLKADLPKIEQLKVTSLYIAPPSAEGSAGGCGDSFDYPRGNFATDPTTKACIASLLDSGVVLLAFDAQARADLDSILRDSEQRGPRLVDVHWVQHSPSGQLVFGSFSVVGDENGYVYAPGKAVDYASQPRSDCAEAIDADWFREWSCEPGAFPW